MRPVRMLGLNRLRHQVLRNRRFELSQQINAIIALSYFYLLRFRLFCRFRVGALPSVPSLDDENSPKAFVIASSFG